MPPSKKFQRAHIINATYEVVKNEGLQVVNARRIAKELNSSVQPIYLNFSTMEELKNAVIEKIYHTYIGYMRQGANEEKAYQGMGMAYIRFARDYPNFFKILFMTESNLSPDCFIQNDDMGNDVLQTGQIFSGLSLEEQKKFHLKVWVFTHGIATLAATSTVNFTDEEIKELFGSTVREMLMGFKIERKQGEK